MPVDPAELYLGGDGEFRRHDVPLVYLGSVTVRLGFAECSSGVKPQPYGKGAGSFSSGLCVAQQCCGSVIATCIRAAWSLAVSCCPAALLVVFTMLLSMYVALECKFCEFLADRESWHLCCLFGWVSLAYEHIWRIFEGLVCIIKREGI